jgi:hypothetical protein
MSHLGWLLDSGYGFNLHAMSVEVHKRCVKHEDGGWSAYI